MSWSAVFPLIGVVIGALLAPWTTFLFARSKDREERRRDAYLSFLRAMGDIANKNEPDNKPQLLDAVRRANLEMMVYGSPRVIEKMQNIIRIADFSRPEIQPEFVGILIEMRRDVGSHRFDKESEAIRLTVFGTGK